MLIISKGAESGGGGLGGEALNNEKNKIINTLKLLYKFEFDNSKFAHLDKVHNFPIQKGVHINKE